MIAPSTSFESAIAQRRTLVVTAVRKAGLRGTADVFEYAVAPPEIEDEFGVKLLARKGRAPRDLSLEF